MSPGETGLCEIIAGSKANSFRDLVLLARNSVESMGGTCTRQERGIFQCMIEYTASIHTSWQHMKIIVENRAYRRHGASLNFVQNAHKFTYFTSKIFGHTVAWALSNSGLELRSQISAVLCFEVIGRVLIILIDSSPAATWLAAGAAARREKSLLERFQSTDVRIFSLLNILIFLLYWMFIITALLHFIQCSK